MHAQTKTTLISLALQDAPALIETVFPAQKVSFEAQTERKAVAAQTLTGLGSYWKGRKPLILVRAIVLGSLLPPTDEQRAAARACIADATARLDAGESFADVARDLSADEASAAQGGNVGWVTLSYLAASYANAARDAELNTVIGPVETEYGLHLIEVLDRRMQTLSDDEYQASQQGYFRLWIDTLRAQATIERAEDWDAAVPDRPGLNSLDPAVQAAIENLASQAD